MVTNEVLDGVLLACIASHSVGLVGILGYSTQCSGKLSAGGKL